MRTKLFIALSLAVVAAVAAAGFAGAFNKAKPVAVSQPAAVQCCDASCTVDCCQECIDCCAEDGGCWECYMCCIEMGCDPLCCFPALTSAKAPKAAETKAKKCCADDCCK